MSEATSWYRRGACAGTDPDIFFRDKKEARERALGYCEDCTVRFECREYALTLPQQGEGVWGGTTQRRRQLIFRNRTAVTRRHLTYLSEQRGNVS